MKKTKIGTGKLNVAAIAAAGDVTRPPMADEFKQIPRWELHPDPDQPRKAFDQAALEELAESIRAQGIIQPLIVRFVKAKYRLIEPDLMSDQWHVEEWLPPKNGDDGVWSHAFQSDDEDACRRFAGEANLKDCYMIVAGERRWRAAEIAGLESIPCIVRDLDAHRVFAQQFIENEARQNITALEEAEALQKQLEGRRSAGAIFSVEDLAKELGMSRAGLYQRLALTRLHAPVREALVAGKISMSQASVVATIPTPAAQEKLLKHITNENDWHFPWSVREVQELVEEDYCKQLNSAPFDQDTVFPGIELGSTPDGPGREFVELAKGCGECPYRTGNMTEQFPDLAKRPNVCTRPDCFAAKCKAHWLMLAEKEKLAGKTVMVPKEFKKVKGEYIRADKPETGNYGLFESHYYDAPEKVLGKHAPVPVLVATENGLEKFYKRTDIPAAAKAAKVKLTANKAEKTLTPEQKAKAEADKKAAYERQERMEIFVYDKCSDLLKALKKLNDKTSWKVAQLLAHNCCGYGHSEMEPALSVVDQADPRLFTLTKLFADEDNYPLTGGEWKTTVVDAWKQAGVDLVAEFDAEEKKAQQSLAMSENKKGVEQAVLLTVKKNKKK